MQRLKEVLYLKKGGNIDDLWKSFSIQQRKKYIYDHLKKNGYNDLQSRAIVGNLEQENSTFDTRTINPNPKSKAMGIAQWTGPRKKELNSKYKNPMAISSQLDHLLYEISGKSKNGWQSKHGGRNLFMNTTDLQTAVNVFSNDFERAGNHEKNNRQRYKNAVNMTSDLNTSYPDYVDATPPQIVSEMGYEKDTGMGADNDAYLMYKMGQNGVSSIDLSKIPMDTRAHMLELYKREEESEKAKIEKQRLEAEDQAITQELEQQKAERNALLERMPVMETVSYKR